jgi:hypothetical protein
MAGDRARVSYDPSRMWRGLIAQQGRVSLEADWNEAAMIADERDRQATLDVVGRFATPDRGYEVTGVAPGGERARAATRDFVIEPGTLYVGGERLCLTERVLYSEQPDWLDRSTDPMWQPAAAPDGEVPRELVYLLAAEQEASAVEDPSLSDVALGGPDTMQRRRILQRFVRCRIESDSCESSRETLDRSLGEQGLMLDPESMRARSGARLKVSFPPGSAAATPAAPGGYLGADNQMIRVMVTSIDPGTGTPTIVWGFDNASFLYRVANPARGPEDTGTALTLVGAPVDSYHYPQRGQAVELLRDAVKLTEADYIASPTGVVSAVTAAYDPVGKTLSVAQLPAESESYLNDYANRDQTPQPYLRVWQATAPAPPSQPVLLGDTGVCVTLTTGEGFHVGDFWQFALRPIQPMIVYPERYLQAPQPPDGPRTWACPLAVVTWGEGDDLTASSCIPRFSSLARLGAPEGGCRTVDIGPEQVHHGATLQAALDEHARSGPVTVCLEPGTYTLPAPLRLGPELDGITLQACREGVVLRGPSAPGDMFATGLIVIRNTASVTIRGIELSPPRVSWSPASRTFSGLHARNQQLLTEFSRELRVAIGMSVQDCVDLTVENCIFDLPDQGGEHSFGAGIFATGAVDGAQIKGCTFQAASTPEADRRRRRREHPPTDPDRALTFHKLAAGEQAETPHELTFGYLQVPTFETGSRRDRQERPHRLVDAAIERCLFQGVTVPALIMAHLGTLLVSRNIVGHAYGGFWLISLPDPELTVMFDRIAIGEAEAYRQLAERYGGTALLDRILVLATAIGQLLPPDLPLHDRPAPRRLLTASSAQLALARAAFTAFYARAAESAELAPVIGALFPTPDTSGTEAHVRRQSRSRSDERGPQPRLQLELGSCQIDAVTAESDGGAALLVADFTAEAGSAFIHDNRIRSRFPDGETALVGGVAEGCVLGNVVANEAEREAEGRTGRSMGLFPATDPPGVAITGNVFIRPTRLPRRAQVPEAFDSWDPLNTVIL